MTEAGDIRLPHCSASHFLRMEGCLAPTQLLRFDVRRTRSVPESKYGRGLPYTGDAYARYPLRIASVSASGTRLRSSHGQLNKRLVHINSYLEPGRLQRPPAHIFRHRNHVTGILPLLPISISNDFRRYWRFWATLRPNLATACLQGCNTTQI